MEDPPTALKTHNLQATHLWALTGSLERNERLELYLALGGRYGRSSRSPLELDSFEFELTSWSQQTPAILSPANGLAKDQSNLGPLNQQRLECLGPRPPLPCPDQWQMSSDRMSSLDFQSAKLGATYFNWLNRNKLAHRIAPSVIRKPSALYLLEALVREANVNLVQVFAQIASQSSHELGQSLYQLQANSNSTNIDYNYYDCDELDKRAALDYKKSILGLSETSSMGLVESSLSRRRQAESNLDKLRVHSGDSGISLDLKCSIDFKPDLLKWHLNFKFSARAQLIVSYSISLFRQLIDSSDLFKLARLPAPSGTETERQLSPRQLQLLACVECQKLRSSLRYTWITKCLLFAYGSGQIGCQQLEGQGPTTMDELDWEAARAACLPRLVDSRKPSYEAEQVYASDQLAILMGLLVRTYLLEPAFDRWCTQMIELAQVDKDGPRMLACLDLIEGDCLQVSQVSDELKQVFGFVVDELASVCQRLPRLDSQLSSLQGCPNGASSHIVVVQAGDDLVAQTKTRLEKLVDNLEPLHTKCIVDRGREQKQLGGTHNPALNWIHNYYLLALQLANSLRGADGYQLEPSSSAAACEHLDDRLVQLRLAGEQIRQLDRILGQLEFDAPRYEDLAALLRLDCEPLRQSLVRCLCKERLLLVRLLGDDQIRLMEQIRLQLDEIELGADLETAIEDYLNERWQARNQAPADQEQRLVLTSDDLGDDGDELGVLSGPEQDGRAPEDEQVAAQASSAASATDQPARRDEEELLAALEGGNIVAQQQQQQMLAISAAAATPLDRNQNSSVVGSLLARESRIAPLVESRLLVARYAHLARVVLHELVPLRADALLALEGLAIRSELSPEITVTDIRSSLAADPNLVHEDELIVELAMRLRELPQTLALAKARLDTCRSQIVALNEYRSKVLSKLVLEFHQLMHIMANRWLMPDETGSQQLAQPASGSGITKEQPGRARHVLAIQQLDSIQESADLARKLHIRHGYLACQNQVLARELNFLQKAKLGFQTSRWLANNELACEPDEPLDFGAAGSARALILAGWADGLKLLAALWCLAEEFETQQVKWLNSDIKRLEFGQVEDRCEHFESRFAQLQLDLKAIRATAGFGADQSAFISSLESNARVLGEKLLQFQVNRKPVLKLLTNRCLVDAHWRQLALLLAGPSRADPVALATSARACTTLAQFLELCEFQQVPVEEFERLDRRASIEHKLEMFLRLEKGGPVDWQRGAAAKLSGWLDGWTDPELELVAVRLLEARVPVHLGLNCEQIAGQMLGVHSLVRRHLKLTGQYGLDLGRREAGSASRPSKETVTLRSHARLLTSDQVEPSLFVEMLRLFVRLVLSKHQRMARRAEALGADKARIEAHLADIDEQTRRLDWLHENQIGKAGRRVELALVQLERDTVRLELERELLATREAAAGEQQREALRIRDHCIRQISERAIPALRAATRALDCLSGRSLRALRGLGPRPPESVRLVVEAVCLLRSWCSTGAHMAPERHFDALTGRMQQDYWPAAQRQLAGTHSSRLLADLRALDKKTIPSQLMRLIRRNYLSRELFRLPLIERVSREAALLARWLIAVDIFERVINVVRPNYQRYMDAERRLASLLAELGARRRQIDTIGRQLQLMEENSRLQLGQRVQLADSLSQCDQHLALVSQSRSELQRMLNRCQVGLDRLAHRRRRLVRSCLEQAAKLVYLDALAAEQRESLADQLAAVRRTGLVISAAAP